MTIEQYIDNITKRFKAGNATEYTFRGDLQQLLESLDLTIRATNEPKRQSCGAPDYIITKGNIPLGFIEAKDLGEKDLDGTKRTGNKEQFDRYKASLSNIIFTDYLHFHWYREGVFVMKIAIGELSENSITPLPENFSSFTNLIKDFCAYSGQTIKSSKRLAERMAAKARLLSDVIDRALTSDEAKSEISTLKDQMHAFRQILIHDITPKGFADVYAQTIAYGMFAARLHDPTLPTFSRQEAAALIPKSNPFLRKLFGYIAGPDIDDRIQWIVDNLVDIFLHCNVEEILKNYGKSTKTEDPIIHFYETFLSEYDPKLRKARGVWYTPQPVVNFIVRAVDDILKTEFNMPQGLADNSKTRILVEQQGKKVEKEFHKVQILDPAAGTGTFLAEVIKQIYKTFEGQQGTWSSYVENHLLPRLNGFELLMASYAMAHLKLDLLLKDTGYQSTTHQRFRVYLTNSLEESHPDTGTLFASWLSTEANEANHIKRDTPVMCVIGNPPYSISSSNKGEWIQNLITDYKRNLNEKKINLDDDYIKFIRYGQYFIDKNGSGVLAFISNNSFIDGITHRQMRKSLISSFDKIYILDLHGNASKKEKDPNRGVDENVFDIQQGVSINIFIKNRGLIKSIHHFDLFGKREFKYNFLSTKNMNEIDWNEVVIDNGNCFFSSKDLLNHSNYLKFISITDLMPLSNSGIQTKCDNIAISESVEKLKETVELFRTEPIDKLKKLFSRQESSGWNFQNAKDDLIKNHSILYCNYNYRPLDFRKIIYTGTSSGFLGRSRSIVMKHFVNKENIGICLMRQFFQDAPFSHAYITKSLVDERTMYSNRGGTYLFPLYLYPENNAQQTIGETHKRTPNLNPEIVDTIAKRLGLIFLPEPETGNVCFANNNDELRDDFKQVFTPIDILDYIYAVLHSPSYRKKYKEFLIIDFPRIPYPKDTDTFWKLVRLGDTLRQIHLLEFPPKASGIEKFITGYPVEGGNIVLKPKYLDGKVYINDSQYFDNISQIAWEFYIGGYQPAQKWLKDRKGRKLEFDDIQHYQKIVVALSETDRLMKEIDKIAIE